MPKDFNNLKNIISDFEKTQDLKAYSAQIMPLSAAEVARLPNNIIHKGNSAEHVLARRSALQAHGVSTQHLANNDEVLEASYRDGTIENFIGLAKTPVGLAGPLLVRGAFAQGDFYVPMATTEGTLIASYSRGMKACRMSGGISAVCILEGVQRSPYFRFRNIGEVGEFLKWIYQNIESLNNVISEASRFAKLMDTRTTVEGNSVILTFEYSTGDAAGQNMVTICTDRICKFIVQNCPITPQTWYIESNYSGDKKATALSFINVRGKKLISEVLLHKEIVENVLRSTPKKMAAYWQASTLGVMQSGSIGAQGHVANGLTAIFLACGQDVACISESSVGLTRMEVTEEGDLYVSLSLPSLIVGTVGGGTNHLTQNECLAMMDCAGPGKAKKFAEICCAVALAGEVSIAAAMSVDHFTQAHQDLGRK